MVSVSGNGYRLLGYVVWQGGKWYLRRRLPSRRTLVLAGVAVSAGLSAAVLLAKRAGG
jgi:hypothetical protein